DDEQFAPFFRKLNEQKTTVYVHHVPVPVENKMLCDYNNLRRSYGRCVDQATAIGREVFSGFFEKYPNLTFVHSMLGGGFFALSSMLFPQQSKAKDKVQRFEVGQSNVKEQYEQHIYFEMSHAQPWGKEQLECAVKVLGADHIVFGTSYPVRREWLLGGPAFVQALDITDEEKDLILCKNAQRLYNI
ncbi:MAG: amidohydrolase, partial [Clostridiales bacterium]|nr:amidohydrolase [Clostridiales bacterium]